MDRKFKVTRTNCKTNKTLDYGIMSYEEMQNIIPKNYVFNGLFWENENTMIIYNVCEQL